MHESECWTTRRLRWRCAPIRLSWKWQSNFTHFWVYPRIGYPRWIHTRYPINELVWHYAHGRGKPTCGLLPSGPYKRAWGKISMDRYHRTISGLPFISIGEENWYRRQKTFWRKKISYRCHRSGRTGTISIRKQLSISKRGRTHLHCW